MVAKINARRASFGVLAFSSFYIRGGVTTKTIMAKISDSHKQAWWRKAASRRKSITRRRCDKAHRQHINVAGMAYSLAPSYSFLAAWQK